MAKRAIGVVRKFTWIALACYLSTLGSAFAIPSTASESEPPKGFQYVVANVLGKEGEGEREPGQFIKYNLQLNWKHENESPKIRATKFTYTILNALDNFLNSFLSRELLSSVYEYNLVLYQTGQDTPTVGLAMKNVNSAGESEVYSKAYVLPDERDGIVAPLDLSAYSDSQGTLTVVFTNLNAKVSYFKVVLTNADNGETQEVTVPRVSNIITFLDLLGLRYLISATAVFGEESSKETTTAIVLAAAPPTATATPGNTPSNTDTPTPPAPPTFAPSPSPGAEDGKKPKQIFKLLPPTATMGKDKSSIFVCRVPKEAPSVSAVTLSIRKIVKGKKNKTKIVRLLKFKPKSAFRLYSSKKLKLSQGKYYAHCQLKTRTGFFVGQMARFNRKR